MTKKIIKKKSNPTPGLAPSTKITEPIWLEDYIDFQNHQTHPVTKSFLIRLGKELLEFSKKPHVLRLEQFFIERNIPSTTGQTWAVKYPEFGLPYQAAKEIIYMRREDGAMNFKLHYSTIANTQFKNDPLWKEAYEYRMEKEKEIKQALQKEESRGSIKVILETIPNSTMVPIKESHEND